MVTKVEVRATARAYRTEAEFFPGMGHNMMLEPGWAGVAETNSRVAAGSRPRLDRRGVPRARNLGLPTRLTSRHVARSPASGVPGAGLYHTALAAALRVGMVRQADAEHVVHHRPQRGHLGPVDVRSGHVLQGPGEQCEQAGAVVRADFDDQSTRRAVEPQNPRWRGRMMNRNRCRRLTDRFGILRRAARCSSVPKTSTSPPSARMSC